MIKLRVRKVKGGTTTHVISPNKDIGNWATVAATGNHVKLIGK